MKNSSKTKRKDYKSTPRHISKKKAFNKSAKINNASSDNYNRTLIFGKHPCYQALLNKNRKIYKIFTTKNSHDELLSFLKDNKILHLESLINKTDKIYLDRIVGKDQNHQNIVLSTSKIVIKGQSDLLEILKNKANKSSSSKMPNILILDQVTDPHNIGSIIRSAVAFNFNIIVFSRHNSIQENSIIAKSSAGNLEFIQPFIADNISDLIIKLKKFGYWNIGLAGEASQDISEITKFDNKVLILGSEGKGIRQLVKKNCDVLLKIDICQNVESLNVANAASIALFEATKPYIGQKQCITKLQ